jgi:hypothetical protein
MRRLTLILAVAIACALAAVAAAQAALTAGTLARSEPVAVEATRGIAVFSGGGMVVGRVERGALLVRIPPAARPDADVAVFGRTGVPAGDARIYEGRDVRFRIAAERLWIEVSGSGVSLSIVGHGFVSTKGTGTLEAGDGPERRLESTWRTLRLGVPRARDSRPTLRALARAEIRWMRSEGLTWARVMATDAWRLFVRLSPP